MKYEESFLQAIADRKQIAENEIRKKESNESKCERMQSINNRFRKEKQIKQRSK